MPTTGDNALQPQGTEVAVELAPSLQYDRRSDAFVRMTDGSGLRGQRQGLVRQRQGGARCPAGRRTSASRTSRTMIHDPLVRKPFLSVFAWTFVFAATTVLFSFAIGLFLAIALDKKGLRFQKLYRSVVVIPYAIPGFLSLLVWHGLLNDDFGVVNQSILGHIGWHPPWLFGGNVVHWIPFITWPRIAVIFVSVWLTTPVLLPRLDGRAAVDPRGADRGGAGGRRPGAPDLPPRHAAAPARRGRAADDRVVRVQLQQLQQHLPLDPGRPVHGRVLRRGEHGHPDQLHVQDRDRRPARAATTRSRARSRSSSSSWSPRSRPSRSCAPRHWRR